MTTYYVGIGGNDGNSGLTWALRLLTLNAAEDKPVATGDLVYVGPGVYREMLTLDISGGNAYQVGTVSVTNGSKQITGNGTAWLANVAADYMFHAGIFASGNDGVANGTATFTSAAGNFQVSMIGQIIQINTRNSYRIGAVAAANSITLVDVNGVGWPGAAGGLTYSVMSGQGHYDVDSVDDNTTIQLKQPWGGPTITGLSYITFNPIRYIGDVTGEHTDGVGGIVRITGSDNDQTGARADCIASTARDYRVFRGFMVDSSTGCTINMTNCDHCVVEDSYLLMPTTTNCCFGIFSTATNITIRRCTLVARGDSYCIWFSNGATLDDSGHLIENSILLGGSTSVKIDRVGGITFRNVSVPSRNGWGIHVSTALVVGQATTVYNSILQGNGTALQAPALGQLVEDFNNLFANSTERVNVAVGGSSVSYPSLFLPPLLHSGADQISGFKVPWQFFALSEWSQVQAIAGRDEPRVDLFGIARPVTASKNSWGPIQFQDMERETGTVHTGVASICLHDAGRHQMWMPVADESTTISVYVYREANYAGNLPQMIIKQPGQVDVVVTDTGAAGAWNLLTTTLTPAADPPYVVIELVSRNTAAAGNYETFFDDL